MPVIFLKYKPDLIPDKVTAKLVSELPTIVSRALDVPEDATKRLTPADIQVWAFPPNKFDVNTKGLQMMIPLHHYQERIVNLEERKEVIVSEVRRILGDLGSNIGWIWILPSSDTAFGRI